MASVARSQIIAAPTNCRRPAHGSILVLDADARKAVRADDTLIEILLQPWSFVTYITYSSFIVNISFIIIHHFLLLKPLNIVYNERKLLHHKHQKGTQKGQ